MSVGLLIVTHERIASALLETAVNILGRCPLPATVLPVTRDSDPDEMRERIRAKLDELDQGDGVLLLLDMYGSTPSNVACSLVDGRRVRVVTGINLPMLVRVLNYAHLGLVELAEKAVSGGRDGVFSCEVGDG